MTDEQKIFDEILAGLTTVLEDLLKENFVEAKEIKSDTPLVGEDGLLSSFLVTVLVVAAEGWIEERYGKSVLLSEDPAVLEPDGPLGDLQRLARYFSEAIQRQAK
ncbi:MAG: hypothetical protein HQL45_01035 [Alphaproteobacteria bacterium]|nr:hypothetical protein [Alphaproteobacteria bacterium]